MSLQATTTALLKWTQACLVLESPEQCLPSTAQLSPCTFRPSGHVGLNVVQVDDVPLSIQLRARADLRGQAALYDVISQLC